MGKNSFGAICPPLRPKETAGKKFRKKNAKTVDIAVLCEYYVNRRCRLRYALHFADSHHEKGVRNYEKDHHYQP